VPDPEAPARGERPAQCVECKDVGSPTEGITFACWTCGAIICAGHGSRHEQRLGHSFRKPLPTELDRQRASDAAPEWRP
jgi:hypothetical protein